jgi:hypothetical protein
VRDTNPVRVGRFSLRGFDFRAVTDKIVVAFSYGMGIAAAKWLTTVISIRGFNLSF